VVHCGAGGGGGIFSILFKVCTGDVPRVFCIFGQEVGGRCRRRYVILFIARFVNISVLNILVRVAMCKVFAQMTMLVNSWKLRTRLTGLENGHVLMFAVLRFTEHTA
jgi:hypothetical protein